MTAELFVGIAFGLWIAIIAYTWYRNHTDRKNAERRASRRRQTVTISDPLLDDADITYSFESSDERKAFMQGVEAGRDATVTAMKLRKRIPTDYDMEIEATKAESVKVQE